jgi:site-specific DNA-methyltransferase (adenine-specific)
VLSRFNARRQRAAAQVTRLADRMKRNGFETSRALWPYPENEHYEVFAGGTRLAAAQAAGLDQVPVLVYPPEDMERISRLADEDNENDEYHVPVPLPDVWAEYKRLRDEEGWTQEDIGKAKGVDQAAVSRRLRFATFPSKVEKAFMQHDFLKEVHASELLKLCNFHNFDPWLTRDQAMAEIVDTVLEKHRGSSADKAPTASVFRKHVDAYNTMLAEVDAIMAQLPLPFHDVQGTLYEPRKGLLHLLAHHKVRTAKDVQHRGAQALHVCHQMQAELRVRHEAQAREVAEEEARLQAELARQARRTALLQTLQHGDCRDLLPTCPGPIRLLLTDPPYGTAFQSQRRVTSAKKARIPGDTPVEACALLADLLAMIKPKLAADAHLLVFAHEDSFCDFRHILAEAGFTLRRSFIWDKVMHGLGDTTRGTALTETERILHAVQGNPKFQDDVPRQELLAFPTQQDSEHPHAKPLALLTHLIQLTTAPGDLVVDPCAGDGTTLLAALGAGRRGWACERDAATYQRAADRLYTFVEEHLHADPGSPLAAR